MQRTAAEWGFTLDDAVPPLSKPEDRIEVLGSAFQADGCPTTAYKYVSTPELARLIAATGSLRVCSLEVYREIEAKSSRRDSDEGRSRVRYDNVYPTSPNFEIPGLITLRNCPGFAAIHRCGVEREHMRALCFCVSTCYCRNLAKAWGSGVLRINDLPRFVAALDTVVRLESGVAHDQWVSCGHCLYRLGSRDFASTINHIEVNPALVKPESDMWQAEFRIIIPLTDQRPAPLTITLRHELLRKYIEELPPPTKMGDTKVFTIDDSLRIHRLLWARGRLATTELHPKFMAARAGRAL